MRTMVSGESSSGRIFWLISGVFYLVLAITGLACLPLARVGERPGGRARG